MICIVVSLWCMQRFCSHRSLAHLIMEDNGFNIFLPSFLSVSLDCTEFGCLIFKNSYLNGWFEFYIKTKHEMNFGLGLGQSFPQFLKCSK